MRSKAHKLFYYGIHLLWATTPGHAQSGEAFYH